MNDGLLDNKSYLMGYEDGKAVKYKELSDEDISRIYQEVSEPFGEKRIYEIHTFARAIIKASRGEE